jgi:hypothetical protein
MWSEPKHCPKRQESPDVQGLPSSQEVPSALIGFEHTPVAGSQVPTSWQASRAVQVTGSLMIHSPKRHASPVVQASPSSQEVPSNFGGLEHTPVAGSQVPAS